MHHPHPLFASLSRVAPHPTEFNYVKRRIVDLGNMNSLCHAVRVDRVPD
jgi:hypothetical protein